MWTVGGLEVTTGKESSIEAMNGSTVLLPCKYISCIGIHRLYFSWHYNNNGTMIKVWAVSMAVWLNASDFNTCILCQYCDAVIPNEDVEPRVKVFHKRVEFVGSNTNISILLWNITFEDEGEYVCFAKNPKEKNRNHSAVFTLIVVDQSK